jgi:hypothetical protein
MTEAIHAADAERLAIAARLRQAMLPAEGAPTFAPDEVMALMRLALEASAQGHLETAERLLIGALGSAPSHPKLLLALAHLRELQGRLSESLALLGLVELLEPEQLSHGLTLVMTCLRAGQREAALTLLEVLRERCERRAPGGEIHQRIQALVALQRDA